MAAEESPPEPLKYKTWVLKVSIHCEGCKKKVKRILHNIEGVYAIDVDSKLHKVTVTGNVESDTLIKKLEKSGKHAEVWSENQEKKTSKSKKKDKEGDPENSQGEEEREEEGEEREEEKGGSGDQQRDRAEKPKAEETAKVEGSPTAKNIVEAERSKPVEISNPGKTPVVGSVRFKEVKFEDKKSEAEPPAPEKKGPECSSGGGKKKKKKGQKGQTENKEEGRAAAASDRGPSSSELPLPGQIPVCLNPGPPIYHHMCEYPPRYYAPPPPSVNYNTANPVGSYTTSYYAAPPIYSYAYTHPAGAVEVDTPLPEATERGPLDSFEMFSDENPNACSVM